MTLHRWARAGFVVVVGISSAYVVHRAVAAGIPSTNPLVYRGVLEDNGGPVSGNRDIQLNVWDDATSTSAANLKCNVVPPDPTPIDSGRFELALGADCVQAVHDHNDLWIEVVVDGTSLGRSPVGAVPYAVESSRPVYVNPITGKTSSLGGFCGASAPTTGNVIGGYAGAKQLCETTCGHASAHVCSPDEITRFAATGGTSAGGRVQSGIQAVIGRNSAGDLLIASDCNGWGTTSTGTFSAGWTTSNVPQVLICSSSFPLLCCD